MLGRQPDEVITPFQRLMQVPAIASIYENLWRPMGYYVASSRSFEQEIRTVLRLGDGRRGERALDLACGTGVFTRVLARRHVGGFVVGLDLSWPMLRRARRLIEKQGIHNVLLVRGTAFRLPFVAGAFQYVNCCGALHLFSQPDAALKEIERVLGSGGHLCVQTTIRPKRSAGMTYFLERFIRFGFFEECELRKKMELQGFSLIESERHRISYTFIAKLTV